ncbi:RNA-directed DNA polymerase, eukaryota [Tanacetum coccineum]
MASMNTRLNIEKPNGNIIQKHGGSKQVGFKQLGPSVETGVHGVHDEKRVWFEVESQGAQGDREAEVFQVSNEILQWFKDGWRTSNLKRRQTRTAGSNSSFIALIPKVSDAKMVKDFRPISLVGSLYKIIAKLLANHLVHVLGDIVNEVQYAFVANRQILDGPFILNELLQWCKSKKKQSLIFKVDFEKAYNSVRWDFLDDVLKKFGFGAKWRGWIQSCLRSSRCSIMVNGSPTEEFQVYKGLKQGDPLSPLLFILVMESLHISFQRVVDAGIFKGIAIGSSLVLSHMFYADDAVFMGQWSDSNIDIIVHVLE